MDTLLIYEMSLYEIKKVFNLPQSTFVIKKRLIEKFGKDVVLKRITSGNSSA